MDEVFINGGGASARLYLEAANPTQQDVLDSNGGRNPRMMLPNGRRTTAVVIKPASDAWVNEGGDLVPAYDDEPLPGVAHMIVTDATGATRNHGRDSVTNTQTPGLYLVSENPEDGLFNYDMVSIHMGVGGGPEGTTPGMISAQDGSNSGFQDADSQSLISFNSADRVCACDAVDPSANNIPPDQIDTSTALKHNMIGGNATDWPMGIQFCGGSESIEDVDEAVYEDDAAWTWWWYGGERYTMKDGKLHRWEGAESIDGDVSHCKEDTGKLVEVIDPSEELLRVVQYGLGILTGMGDALADIVTDVVELVELVNTIFNDWETFKDGIVKGLQGVYDTIKEAAKGKPEAILKALALLEPSVANFISTHFLGKTMDGKDATPGLMGGAVGAVIVAVALYIASGGMNAGKAGAKAGKNIVKDGIDSIGDVAKKREPPQLARGKRAHKEEPVLPGEKAEVQTPSGKRMDRYNEDKCHIREIKPDNPRQIKKGEKQVEGYKKEMEEKTGKPHTGEVSPYDPKKYE